MYSSLPALLTPGQLARLAQTVSSSMYSVAQHMLMLMRCNTWPHGCRQQAAQLLMAPCRGSTTDPLVPPWLPMQYGSGAAPPLGAEGPADSNTALTAAAAG